MGFLAKLWDETLAGPAPPESDIGKLRRYDSAPAPLVPGDVIVSRSITILRSNSGPRNLSVDPDCGSGSGLHSPSGSTTPRTPLTPGTPVTPSGDLKKFTRRKSTAATGGPPERAEPRNPTVYDWIVISALDR